MRADWIPCDRFLPDRDGTYLVTTVNGKVRMDRFVDGKWGLCSSRVKGGQGRYRPHLAWSFVPKPYQAD